MTDPADDFLPDEGNAGEVKPLEQAVDEAARLAGDAKLVAAVRELREQGTLPPHAVQESVRAQAEVLLPAKEKVRARVRARNRGEEAAAPVLMIGRPNTDPGATLEPSAGEPVVATPAALPAEARAEPTIPAEPHRAPPEPVRAPIAPTSEDPNAPDAVTAKAPGAGAPLHGAAFVGYVQAQRNFVASELTTDKRAEHAQDCETAFGLDPDSDAYLDLAEKWLNHKGLDVARTQEHAERDRAAVEARRLRRAEAEEAARVAAPGRRKRVTLGIALLLGLAIVVGLVLVQQWVVNREVPPAASASAGAGEPSTAKAIVGTAQPTVTVASSAPAPTVSATAVVSAKPAAIPVPSHAPESSSSGSGPKPASSTPSSDSGLYFENHPN